MAQTQQQHPLYYDYPEEVAHRRKMVQQQLRRRGVRNARVLEAMGALPRHLFVPPQHRSEAYWDNPIPIGSGQTISQPYIVALMSEKLDVRAHHHVMDIGAGSGYQTAILAQLAGQVYAIERLADLTEQARARLAALSITNVDLRTGDGALGWPEPMMFDRILIAAAAPQVPPAVLEQLADDGRLIAPIGDEFGQRLVLFHKHHQQIEERFICYCRFVKFIENG